MMSAVRSRPRPRGLRQTEASSDLELYKLARAQVEHENTLVSQRITWYLTLQGFLLTAVFLTAANLLDPKNASMHPTGRLYLAIAIGLLCLLGVGSSITCYLLIRVAYKQIKEVAGWWNGRAALTLKFPRITGEGGFDCLGYRVTAADFTHVILLIWVVLVALLILASNSGAGLFAEAQHRATTIRVGDGCSLTVH